MWPIIDSDETHKSQKEKESSDVNEAVPLGEAEEESKVTTSSTIPHHRKKPSDVELIRQQTLEISEEIVARIVEVDSDLNEEAIDAIEDTEESNSMFTKLILVPFADLNSTLFGGFFPESLLFAFRFSISTTISSIFLLASPLNDHIYESIWILVTVSVVSWSASNDSGTILKRLGERMVGTCLGAVLAFAVGYVSLTFENVHAQAIFLGLAFAVESFLYPYVADRCGYRSSYGAIIGNVTFGIAVSGFYDQQSTEDPWKIVLFRVVNIIVGCLIVALVSLTVFPVSTKALMMKNVTELMMATGKSTEMILKMASDSFQNGRKPRSIAELLWTDKTDEVHMMYIKNLDGWKDARSLLPTLKYDPWFLSMSEEEKHLFKYYMIAHVARTFRIQLNAVLLDSIIRSDADYKGPMEALPLLVDIGESISKIMNMTVALDQRKVAVKLLLEKHLLDVRLILTRTSEATPRSSQVNIAHLESVSLSQFSSLPLSALNAEGEQTLLFLHLVEQLILRVVRVYFCSEQYELHVDNHCRCRI